MKHVKHLQYLSHTGLLLSFLLLQTLGSVIAGTAQASFGDIRDIKHIIFIIKENHSFDSYFGLFPHARGTTTGKITIPGGVKSITLRPAPDNPTNFKHTWQAAHTDYNGGLMDQFNLGSEKPSCDVAAPFPASYPCYIEAKKSLIPGYWDLAQHFVLADNAFSSVLGPSFPNHLYTVAAAAGPDPTHSAINNPNNKGTTPLSWGCDANPMTTVELYPGGKTAYPCFGCHMTNCLPHVDTLADRMDAAKVPWKYYTPMGSDPARVLNTLSSFYQDRNSPNIVPVGNFDTDVKSGTLPAFSWLIPPDKESEHPPKSTCVGENWTLEKINEVKSNTKLWANTVIVVTWDDFGGLYDHIPPPQQPDKLGYGFRVPFLIISPFAKSGFISHTQYDFTSVLKLAERRWKLPPLSTRDKMARSIEDALDFTHTNTASIPQPRLHCP